MLEMVGMMLWGIENMVDMGGYGDTWDRGYVDMWIC